MGVISSPKPYRASLSLSETSSPLPAMPESAFCSETADEVHPSTDVLHLFFPLERGSVASLYDGEAAL